MINQFLQELEAYMNIREACRSVENGKGEVTVPGKVDKLGTIETGLEEGQHEFR